MCPCQPDRKTRRKTFSSFGNGSMIFCALVSEVSETTQERKRDQSEHKKVSDFWIWVLLLEHFINQVLATALKTTWWILPFQYCSFQYSYWWLIFSWEYSFFPNCWIKNFWQDFSDFFGLVAQPKASLSCSSWLLGKILREYGSVSKLGINYLFRALVSLVVSLHGQEVDNSVCRTDKVKLVQPSAGRWNLIFAREIFAFFHPKFSYLAKYHICFFLCNCPLFLRTLVGLWFQ